MVLSSWFHLSSFIHLLLLGVHGFTAARNTHDRAQRLSRHTFPCSIRNLSISVTGKNANDSLNPPGEWRNKQNTQEFHLATIQV